ncbi:hypothetical protein C5167_024900, partial [Papaver somniferum]
ILTCHRRWQVYRGDSSDSRDLLFSVKKSSLLQIKTRSFFERSCAIYAGDSKNLIAQMHRKHTVQSIVLDQDTYSITGYPNVDYAFVFALCVVLNEINMDRSGED